MTDSETLTDIAGNDISPGDTVVYPQMSGRSVQMVLGTFQGYNGKTAKIVREGGSRWRAAYPEDARYRDKRTGKGIDPSRTLKHYKVRPSYTFTHKVTGEVRSRLEGEKASPAFQEAYDAHYRSGGWGWSWNGQQPDSEWVWGHHEGEFHDYVEKYTPEPKPVTIQNVSNIVKVVAL